VCHQIWQFTVQCKYTCINIYCRGCTFKTFLTQVPSLHVSPAAQSHKLRYTLFRSTLSSLGYITVMLIGVLFGRHVSPSPRRSLHVAMLYGYPPGTCEKKFGLWNRRVSKINNLVNDDVNTHPEHSILWLHTHWCSHIHRTKEDDPGPGNMRQKPASTLLPAWSGALL